jgi:hypothetical protein
VKLGLWILSLTLAWSGLAHAAEYAYPTVPNSVPDGKTASQDEMVSAMSAFKQYNSDVTTYLACLDTETSDKLCEAAGATSAVVQIKSLQAKKHNIAVDELQKMASKFNEEVRTFKARK